MCLGNKKFRSICVFFWNWNLTFRKIKIIVKGKIRTRCSPLYLLWVGAFFVKCIWEGWQKGVLIFSGPRVCTHISLYIYLWVHVNNMYGTGILFRHPKTLFWPETSHLSTLHSRKSPQQLKPGTTLQVMLRGHRNGPLGTPLCLPQAPPTSLIGNRDAQDCGETRV